MSIEQMQARIVELENQREGLVQSMQLALTNYQRISGYIEGLKYELSQMHQPVQETPDAPTRPG